MWTAEHRRNADRRGLRYPSDLTDAEWELVKPMIPPAKHGGRRREVDVREVLNSIFYVLWTGCQWGALPKDLVPKSTAHSYFMLWEWDGTLERIHHALYVAERERQGREASPSAAGDRQPERQGGSKGGSSLDPQGYDAGKKVTGRKRHILVDTLGLLLSVAVHPADVQDRDGARDLLRTARRLFPFIERIFADAGYQGAGPSPARSSGPARSSTPHAPRSRRPSIMCRMHGWQSRARGASGRIRGSRSRRWAGRSCCLSTGRQGLRL